MLAFFIPLQDIKKPYEENHSTNNLIHWHVCM